MSPGDWCLIGGTICYIGAAVSYYLEGIFPLALVEALYAGANAGLIWLAHWRAK